MGQEGNDAGTRRNGETEIRGQKSEVGGKTTGVRFSHIEILLWERISRPSRLSESDGGQAASGFRIWDFGFRILKKAETKGRVSLLPLTAHRLPFTNQLIN